MLRLFFHRESLFVKISFGMGILFMVLFFTLGKWSEFSTPQKILALILLGQIFYALFAAFYPWYPKGVPGPGIRLQFQKALVPVGYIWMITSLLFWITPPLSLLIVFNVILLPISIVACILIYFHFKDPDPRCPNLLSGTPREKL